MLKHFVRLINTFVHKKRRDKIFLSGTNGLPGRYGGWDPILHELSQFLSRKGYTTVVHTEHTKRNEDTSFLPDNCSLHYVPIRANGMQSIFYDFYCFFHAFKSNGVVVMFGTSGGLFIPFFRLLGLPIITNLDGEEWKRDKWSVWVKCFLYISDLSSILFSSAVIADHPVIKKRASNFYNRNVSYIPYGVDHIKSVSTFIDDPDLISKYSFSRGEYFFTVCRIEPENSIHIILEAFSSLPSSELVIMGNWSNSLYGINLRNKYQDFPNIFMLDAQYDKDLVSSLRFNALAYIHGHTVGGTNPSLLEALRMGCQVIVHNNHFNRYVAGYDSLYFETCQDLISLIGSPAHQYLTPLSFDQRQRISENVSKRYNWEDICESYLALVSAFM